MIALGAVCTCENTVFRLRWPSQRAAWLLGLRLTLLALLFSALQGTLGAWLLPLLAQRPVAEICTPRGMQWVVLESAPVASSVAALPGMPEPDRPDWPQGLAKPCVWAMAQVGLPCGPDPAGNLVTAALHADLQPVPIDALRRAPDTITRVLLMAPMRAPPRKA